MQDLDKVYRFEYSDKNQSIYDINRITDWITLQTGLKSC